MPTDDDYLDKRVKETQWIWEDNKMKEKPITFVPLLFNLFEEVLLSAVDVRKGVKDALVKIDVEHTKISIWTHGESVNLLHRPGMMMQPITHFEWLCGVGSPVPKKVVNRLGEKLKEFRISGNWCMLSFKPQLALFGMECLEGDIVALMKRRVVDLAGYCTGVKVELDGTCRVLPRTFKDYVDLYLETCTHTTRIFEKVNSRLEICVALAYGHLENSNEVGFVNNIPTMNGGPYVDYITSQITYHLASIMNLKPNDIKSHLLVFVNDTTNECSFVSRCDLTREFLMKIADSLFEDLSKNAGKLSIPKLQDAKLANTPYSQQCTLILTEADIATVFAMSELGQDIAKYGVFTLEGDLLNVREASRQELEKSTDIQNIKKILGLQDGKNYENVKELRYGHLMIMVNDDHDGSRIKGLLINFLHYFWPSLLKVKKFMQWFVEPIVKASHKRTNQVCMFYMMSDYEERKKQLENQFNITWYKELETIDSEQRGGYNFDQHIKDFVWDNAEDGYAIERAFSNKKIEEREHWLQAPFEDLDLKEKGIPYRDFMNKEFKQYAMADLQRSVPSMVDGLKPRERKILFYALKKPIIQKIKVAEFSRYVLDHFPYDDGEVNLVGTISAMAQTYVGSNNINLLRSNMQLGTRRRGGKDHDHADDTLLSSLIFTWLSPITRYLFPEDDELLNYLKEDDQSIEPACFVPIIPLVLVNGSEARGVLSSFIPNYNPRDIIANLKRLLEGKPMLAMLPYYRGFKGEIKKSSSKVYTTYGIIDKDKDTLTITELPVRCWTEDYKEFLEAASRCGKDIKEYKACNSYTSVHFEIVMTEDQMNKAREEGFPNKLKLTTTLSTANMYVLDAEGKLKKYDTPEKLVEDFYRLRLDLYEKRKTSSVLHKLKVASLQLETKVRFAQDFWDGKIVLSRKQKHERCVELRKQGFKTLPSIEREAKGESQEDEDVAVTGYDGYDYLLSLPAGAFLPESIHELDKEREAINKKIKHLTTSTPKSSWLKNLAALDEQLALENYPEAKYTKEEEEKRRTYLHELKIASLQLESKVRFAHEVLNGELVLSKKPKHEKCIQLRKLGFESLPSIKREAREEPREEEDVAAKGYDGYDYLLSLPTESFQHKYIEDLEEEKKANDKKIEHLTTSTTMSLWLKDLATLFGEQLALENKYPEAEKKEQGKRAGDAAGQRKQEETYVVSDSN